MELKTKWRSRFRNWVVAILPLIIGLCGGMPAFSLDLGATEAPTSFLRPVVAELAAAITFSKERTQVEARLCDLVKYQLDVKAISEVILRFYRAPSKASDLARYQKILPSEIVELFLKIFQPGTQMTFEIDENYDLLSEDSGLVRVRSRIVANNRNFDFQFILNQVMGNEWRVLNGIVGSFNISDILATQLRDKVDPQGRGRGLQDSMNSYFYSQERRIQMGTLPKCMR